MNRVRGSVLLLVLFVLVVLSLAAVSLSYRMSLGIRATRDQAIAARADAFNRSAVALAMSRLSADANGFDHPGESWSDPLSPNDVSGLPGWATADAAPDGGSGAVPSRSTGLTLQTRLWVEDEGGRLHVLFASGEAMEDLGFTRDEVDAIFDWMDADADPSPEGAESNTYTSLPLPYRAKDAPVEVLEEVRLVRGLSAASAWGAPPARRDAEEPPISPLALLTVLGDGRVNLNSAKEAVLRALPIREEVVDQLLAFRRFDGLSRGSVEDHAFTSVDDLAQLQGLEDEDLVTLGQIGRFESSFFRIQAMTEDAGSGVRRHLRVLVQREDGGKLSVLLWREGV